MRHYAIISYEFLGKDFRRYSSSFALASDTPNADEAAEQVLEQANEHAACTFPNVYNHKPVCILIIYSTTLYKE